jgi:GDP-L-fucose synthase
MKVLITGGTGLLGSEFKSLDQDCVLIGSKDVDLTDNFETLKFFENAAFEGVDAVIHCAAKVGGLGANLRSPVDFFESNVRINSNVFEAAAKHNMRMVSILSTCIYPDEKFVRYPLTEEQLHMGPPHFSNFSYAYSKRMLDVQTRAYRKQNDSRFVSAILNNIYGPNDNYHLEDAHVVPALIRKFHEAAIRNDHEVTIWGTGRPIREFTFARDAAKIALWLMENYNEADPVNIGNTDQISIESLARMIGEEIGFEGNINFDISKPDGQYKKPSSNQKLKSLGWSGEYTPLRDGLRETIKSFQYRYPDVRGVKI